MTQIEQIKSEIERLRKANEVSDDKDYAQYELDVACGYDDALNDLLSFIESLEKAQPKIEDIQREWYNKGYIKGRKESHIPARELGLPSSLDDNSPKIKGWVARDEDGGLYAFVKKPERSLGEFELKDKTLWEDFTGNGSIRLPKEDFSDLKWEDEPIEVELTIRKV